MKKAVIAALILILAVAIAAVIIYKPKTTTVTPPAAPERLIKKAFLNAEWGMSAVEVEKANGIPLIAAPPGPRLFTPKETVTDTERYQTLQAENVFLSRPARINYLFIDDKLFTYHLFVNDADFHRLDGDMRAALIRDHGEGYSEIRDEGSSLKLVWHNSDTIVNYWIYEEAYRLRPLFTAVIGVVYRPIEEGIS